MRVFFFYSCTVISEVVRWLPKVAERFVVRSPDVITGILFVWKLNLPRRVVISAWGVPVSPFTQTIYMYDSSLTVNGATVPGGIKWDGNISAASTPELFTSVPTTAWRAIIFHPPTPSYRRSLSFSGVSFALAFSLTERGHDGVVVERITRPPKYVKPLRKEYLSPLTQVEEGGDESQ